MDFIPKVKMDFVPDDIDDETGEDNPQFVYDEEEGKEAEEVITKEPEPEESEINPSMNGMGEMNEEEIFEDIPKKPKKKRKPMSEEHKAKLKLAREKAMKVKKEKALERKKMKEKEQKIKELNKKETELKVKSAENRVKELEKQVHDPIEKPLPRQESVAPSFTKKDLEEAQLTAIMKYEALRKERKKQKNIKKEEEKERENMASTLHRALNPRNNFGGGRNYSGF